MFIVKDIVCDYGVYGDAELILICNSKGNAELIAAVLEKDRLCNCNVYKDYVFSLDDFKRFMDERLQASDQSRGKR